MISDKVRDILNEQINKEFYSAYLYLSMSAYFSEIGLYGFSHWTKIQSKEEIEHGMILFEYVLGRKSQVHLAQIATPRFELNSPLEVFEQIYNHERSITDAIDSVANMTEGECDLATRASNLDGGSNGLIYIKSNGPIYEYEADEYPLLYTTPDDFNVRLRMEQYTGGM